MLMFGVSYSTLTGDGVGISAESSMAVLFMNHLQDSQKSNSVMF